jgi:hypothetical protein
VDRIQLRNQEIFGVDIYPRHTNLAQFKAVDDFVAVGIGPLYYDSAFVKPGEPDSRLTGDLLFVAKRMKVKCPPLHLEGPHEKKIFNEFVKAHPKPTTQHWKELAARFLLLTNCKTIFPKLPSMLKSYYNRWKDSQLIVMAEEEMKSDYHALLMELAKPGRGSASKAIEQQLSAQRELAEGTELEATLQAAPENVLPVPPLAAPGQVSFVHLASSQKRDRRCCYFPCCSMMVSKCNGYKRGMCIEVNSGRVALPSPDELAALKEQAQRAEKAASARERRREAKRQRNNES